MANINFEKIRAYYNSSPSYLTDLLGICHFGFTEQGEVFDLQTAQLNMEKLLARKLNLPKNSLVFDGGSGFGRVAKTLALNFGLKIIGGDITYERISESNRYIAEFGLENDVFFANADYGNIPLSDDSVDGAFTMETLVHADSLERVLAEYLRILKPGGKLALFEYSAPKREELDPIRGFITDTMNNETGMASMNRFYHGSFEDILRRAGFENIVVEEISKNVYPTWKSLFMRALHFDVWADAIWRKDRGDFINLLASLMIWPYRKQLGYNVVTATKPNN